jgi:hypothetical protein
MIRMIAAIFLLSVCAHAQTALVIQLKPEDAVKAKQLYDEQTKVDQEIKDLQKRIEDNYLSYSMPISNCTTVLLSSPTVDTPCSPKDLLTVKKEWTTWEFSSDFKFVVPKPNPPVTGGYSWSLTPCYGGAYAYPTTGSPFVINPSGISTILDGYPTTNVAH